MDNQLNVQDLLNVINQYREELANVIEQRMVARALLEKQAKYCQELEKQIAELKQNKEADE